MAANAWPSASLSVPDELELMQSVAPLLLFCSLGPGTLFLEVNMHACMGVKRSADPSSVTVKNEWSRTFTAPCIHGVHRDNFTF